MSRHDSHGCQGSQPAEMRWEMGVSQNYGYLIGGPHNKDHSILGSILGAPYFGKPPKKLARLKGLRVKGLGSG